MHPWKSIICFLNERNPKAPNIVRRILRTKLNALERKRSDINKFNEIGGQKPMTSYF